MELIVHLVLNAGNGRRLKFLRLPLAELELTRYPVADLAEARALAKKIFPKIRREFSGGGDPAFN